MVIKGMEINSFSFIGVSDNPDHRKKVLVWSEVYHALTEKFLLCRRFLSVYNDRRMFTRSWQQRVV